MTVSVDPLSAEFLDAGLSEAWLKAAGFKWHEMERQGAKHWLLWISRGIGEDQSFCDLGVELSFGSWRGPSLPDGWFCWIRSDFGHRYSRFIHVRTMTTAREVVSLIQGMTGKPFDPALCFYGSLYTPEAADRLRREHERLDVRMARSVYPHRDIEKDDTRGGALPEHLDASIKAGKAK